jgi:hypothetical protein
MLQLFVVVTFFVLIGLTLNFLFVLRDSYQDELREIRRIRRRYAAIAFGKRNEVLQHDPVLRGRRSERGKPVSTCILSRSNSITLKAFYNVGDQCA